MDFTLQPFLLNRFIIWFCFFDSHQDICCKVRPPNGDDCFENKINLQISLTFPSPAFSVGVTNSIRPLATAILKHNLWKISLPTGTKENLGISSFILNWYSKLCDLVSTTLNVVMNSFFTVVKDSNEFRAIGGGLGFKKWLTPQFKITSVVVSIIISF